MRSAPLVLALGCAGSVPTSGTTTDTGSQTPTPYHCDAHYDGPILIDEATLTCDKAANILVFDILTQGWCADGWLYVAGEADFGPWFEETRLVVYEQDNCFEYNRADAALTGVVLVLIRRAPGFAGSPGRVWFWS